MNMKTAIKSIIIGVLSTLTSTVSSFNVSVVGELQSWGLEDRPSEGSAKQAVWLGDWNGDGVPEYFVTTKKGGTSSLFYSTPDGGWSATEHWYSPSYSVIALDTQGDARPEYIIKTFKFSRAVPVESYADYVQGASTSKGYTVVLKIPRYPITHPLKPVMFFDRSVPIIQGCVDVDGDGYKDLLVTHHLENSEYVARYYKGRDDSADGLPFEKVQQWASTGEGTTMFGELGNHKARWGDLQIITKDDGSTVKRLFAAGSEGENNNVIYWDYDPETDTFDVDPTILDVSSIERSVDNELHVVSVRALPGAIMLAGRDGAYFMRYNQAKDTYKLKDVPGIEDLMNVEGTEYSDFWCFNSGKDDGTMVFIILRKPDGGKDSTLEFRTFDPSKRPKKQISELLMEVNVPPKAQRITALRTDDSFDTMKDAKQLIVAHKDGATIFDVVY